MKVSIYKVLSIALLLVLFESLAFSQQATKRNDRPQPTEAPVQTQDDNKRPADATRYSWEFSQPQFINRHIVIEHDALGHGQITFERKGEETAIVEPIELSTAALGRILALWTELRFLDSDENYQAAKNFAHLGTYKLSMDDGRRKRTAEFNWSDNKQAWTLRNEYQRVADQAILIFDIKLARENQPLNAPQLMNQLDTMLSRDGLSDPRQLVPLLTELRTDEHVPLIARNHADRILKKIQK